VELELTENFLIPGKKAIIANAIYSIQEAVEVTGFGRTTIYRAEQSGALKVKARGKRRYILGKDLWSWLEKGDGDDER
jgi:Helix-turn-helix domain